MERIGIICEYNPFHNGHIYHINKIKEMYPKSSIVLVMSGNFTERGEISILDKWDKTEVALNHGVDLVVELPLPYSIESADTFASGAIKILSYLNCNKVVFGVETDDIDMFKELANIQLNNPEYDSLVKEYMDSGYNYPTSMSKALTDLSERTVNTANDLLALSYVKEIIKQDAYIEPVCIKRSDDYYKSASSIREALNSFGSISSHVPEDTYELLRNYDPTYMNRFFNYLKFRIITEIDELNKYKDVDEGIESRIKKAILKVKTYDELIEEVKTKRYTKSKLNRMFIHILLNYRKSDSDILKNINYIKVLGFTKTGSNIIKEVKIDDLIPVITNYSDFESPTLDFILRSTFVYNLIMNKEDNNIKELKSVPVIHTK